MKLYEYQEAALAFALDKKASYMAIDMGLGKTAIAIAWVKHLLNSGAIKGVLVLAPLRTVYATWPDEIAQWSNLIYTILHGKKKDSNLAEKVDVYIMNYEGLPWLHKALQGKRVPFDAIIIDEGSMVKAPNTQRFKVLKSMQNLFPSYKMVLSGTPAPNSLLDLWSQYYLLDRGKRLGTGITKYRQSYFNQMDRDGYVWKIREGCGQIIKDAIKDITFRLDGKDHLKIPEKVINTIPIRLPAGLMEKYKELEVDFFTELEDGTTVEATNIMARSAKLRQFMQGALYTNPAKYEYMELHQEKLNALKSLMEECSGKPILCAIQFRFELDIIKKAFPKVKIIAGGTPAATAQQYIQEWNRGEIPLLLCHPASIGHGVNLQTGSNIILWYGISWSLEQYLQFNARLHRNGQKESVIIHHLIADKTIDRVIFKALNTKGFNQTDLLDYLKQYTNY